MTTTSITMARHSIAQIFFATLMIIFTASSCKKTTDVINNSNSNQAAHYPPNVLDKWMTMEIRLMKNTTGIPNQAFTRHFVYAGIAAFESLGPGTSSHTHWSSKWNGLTGLPAPDHSVQYYFPANVNAAMAYMNKALFPNASEADKAAIDSLQNALHQEFLSSQSQSLIDVSSAFGKSVATAVFNWAETDGYKNAGRSYTIPTGDGLWVPTAPAFANPVTPYWGENRPVIKGSINNTQPNAPIAYSTDPTAAFYQMAKQVYDASQNLTDDQKAMAMFWRDVPGVTSPGHWLSIVQQVVHQTNVSLDKAALAYALVGAAMNDGIISCWQAKYKYNLIRPITYIRNVMGYTSWNSYLTTPAHPEYSSAHAVLSVGAAEIMQSVFGNIGSFTDHTYDYLGFTPRTYNSFLAIGKEAAQSRLYAGIHYQPSINAGILQGRKVSENILNYENENDTNVNPKGSNIQ